MRRTKSFCLSPALILLVLAWCGSAHATGALQLAFAGTQPGTWMTPRLTLEGPLPGQFGTWIDIRVKRGDSLSALFAREGLRPDQWQALLDLGTADSALRNLHPGEHFRLRKTPDGRVMALRFRLGPARTLVVDRDNGTLVAAIRRSKPQGRQILVSGVIRSSLSSSVRKAGAPAAVAKAMAHIYAAREDLTEKLQAGDHFSLIYAVSNAAGAATDTAPVVAASIETGGRTYRIFRQFDSSDGAHYYDAQGDTYESGIERTPLDYTIVSSFFSMSRKNPVLGIVRHHTGVDLAAPVGTAVHAAANGTVTFVGWRHGYGRLVKIKHDSGYSTRYAHMSEFASGLAAGDYVRRGQTIGYVGESGVATGYHLHFEIRRNGVPHDPLTMPLPDGKPLSGTMLTAFSSRIQPLIARLSDDTADAGTMIAAATTSGACHEAGAINAVLALAPEQVEADALGQVFCSSTG